jgi:hypothetical protein
MSFDKKYFDSLDELLEEYEREAQPKSGVTVSVHLHTNAQFPLAKILETTDSIVSFLFYDIAKEGDVLPMVSVPYSVIAAVQVESSSTKSKFGFQHRSS